MLRRDRLLISWIRCRLSIMSKGLCASKVSKIHFIIASLVVITILAIGCGIIYSNSLKTPADTEVSENQENIVVNAGQEYTITLISNPSTGYSWSVDDAYDKNVTTMISNKFQAANTNKIGAPGKELWVFKGAGKGSTKLEFTYTRKRENKTSQMNSKTFNVTIK